VNQKIKRANRIDATARAKRRRESVTQLFRQKLARQQVQVRKKVWGVTNLKHHSDINAASTQNKRRIVNKSTPVSPQKSSPAKNSNPVFHQYSTVGNIRQRRRQLHSSIDLHRSRILKRVLSASPLLRANQSAARVLIKEMGLKITRVSDITAVVLAHLRKNYPSLVEDFKNKKKITLTRFREPMKQKWKSIWAQFNSMNKRMEHLNKVREEINAFLEWEYQTSREINNEGAYYLRPPRVLEERTKNVERKRKEIERKYPNLKIDWWVLSKLSEQITKEEKEWRRIRGEVRGFWEDLEVLLRNQPKRYSELIKMKRLPDFSKFEKK
jgi:hypothetical protein